MGAQFAPCSYTPATYPLSLSCPRHFHYQSRRHHRLQKAHNSNTTKQNQQNPYRYTPSSKIKAKKKQNNNAVSFLSFTKEAKHKTKIEPRNEKNHSRGQDKPRNENPLRGKTRQEMKSLPRAKQRRSPRLQPPNARQDKTINEKPPSANKEHHSDS